MRSASFLLAVAGGLLLSGCDGGEGAPSPAGASPTAPPPLASAGEADPLAPNITGEAGGGGEVDGDAAVDIAAAMHMHAAADVPEPNGARSGDTWSSYFGDTVDTDHLTLAAGDAIVLDDCDVRFASLVIEGELSIDDTLQTCGDATMRADTVLVTGTAAALRIGSEADPFAGRFTLSLTGDVAGATRRGTEQRMLHIGSGASFEVYGASAAKRSWTSLEGTVRRGTSTIRVADRNGWEAGDVLVIASSNVDPREAETRTIVATDGRTLTLDAPLEHDHFGEMQTFAGKTIDTRAEVGLLSHDVVIEGDEGSSTDGIGGNIMIMGSAMHRPENNGRSLPRHDDGGATTTARLQGVELRRLGQRGRAGRYSFHWHLVGDGRGQHFRNASVHHGFQRAVNVHGTDDVLVENVVAYDIANHMFVPSEEGDEVRNVFRNNLGVLTRRVFSEADFAFPSGRGGRSGQSEQRASTFWLRNAFNRLEGNRAAGVLGGQGFFIDPAGFAGLHNKLAHEASGTIEICDFENNLAHSLYQPLGSPDLYAPAVRGFGIFMRSRGTKVERKPDVYSHCTFDGVQVYKAQLGGVWTEDNTTLRDAIVADSHAGVVAGDIVEDVVVVGQTRNALERHPLPIDDAAAHASHAHPERVRGGFVQSDNGGQSIVGRRFTDLTCINLPACFTNLDDKEGLIGQYREASIGPVTLIGTPQGFIEHRKAATFAPGAKPALGNFTDVDGALSGVPGTVGDMDGAPFFALTRPMDNQFGWVWEPTVIATE